MRVRRKGTVQNLLAGTWDQNGTVTNNFGSKQAVYARINEDPHPDLFTPGCAAFEDRVRATVETNRSFWRWAFVHGLIPDCKSATKYLRQSK